MIRNRRADDKALTGLELIVLIAGIFFIIATGVVFMNSGNVTIRERTFAGGLVAESIYVSGDNLQPVGNVYGFPSVSRISGTPSVVVRREDPGRLGVIRLIISLFIGDTGAIDMDRVQVQWNRRAGQEYIPMTTAAPLVCPNWMISKKYNMLPGRTADSDNWLEPGEQFEITLCPQESVPPGDTFTVVIQPDGVAMPLSLTRGVPFSISPVMNLG